MYDTTCAHIVTVTISEVYKLKHTFATVQHISSYNRAL